MTTMTEDQLKKSEEILDKAKKLLRESAGIKELQTLLKQGKGLGISLDVGGGTGWLHYDLEHYSVDKKVIEAIRTLLKNELERVVTVKSQEFANMKGLL